MLHLPAMVIRGSPNCSYTGFLLDLSSSVMYGFTGASGCRSAHEMRRSPLAASLDVSLSADVNATSNATSESMNADKREGSRCTVLMCGTCRERNW